MSKKITTLQNKKQLQQTIIEAILNNSRLIEIDHAYKLKNCCNYLSIDTDENGKESFNEPYSCGSPLCQVCLQFKINKEMAITGELYREIKKDNNTSLFYYLTLTMRDCDVNHIKETIQQLNDGFKRLIESEPCNKVVIGYSRYLHIGLNDLDRVQPHLHVVLNVKSSYTGKNSINKHEWNQLWKESLLEDYDPIIQCKSIGKKGKATERDVCNKIAYSLNYVKIDDIKRYPSTYIKLMSKTKRIKKFLHSKSISKIRSKVKSNYKENKSKEITSVTSKSILKFDNVTNKFKLEKKIESDL